MSKNRSIPYISAIAITFFLQNFVALVAHSNNSEPNQSMQAKNAIETKISNSDRFFPNENGIMESYSTFGPIDTNNPFFISREGSNGRSCNTCHVQEEGWSASPKGIQKRFESTQGNDPIFRVNDGSTSPHAPVATLEQKRKAYQLLLNKGLIRVGLPMPENAEFTLEKVDDPYGFASAKELSMFRRILPSTNLKLNVSFQSDLRETFRDPNSKICTPGTNDCFASVETNLMHQANSATTEHAQATAGLTPAEQAAIVAFETSLFTAQIYDNKAKYLNSDGAKGGAKELSTTKFHYGINSPPNDFLTGAEFDIDVFKLFRAWAQSDKNMKDIATTKARESIARGEELFNRRNIVLTNTRGINDDFNSPIFETTCAGCHNGPSAGTRTDGIPVDIGTSDESERTPDLPLYTFKHKETGEIRVTSDPGRALITGLWSDMNRLKVTNLRGLSSRPPYFHNGSAATIKDTVLFYNKRFDMKMTDQEIEDMTAFLSAL